MIKLSNEYKNIQQQSQTSRLFNCNNESTNNTLINNINKCDNGQTYNFIKSLLNRVTVDTETVTKIFESKCKVVAQLRVSRMTAQTMVNASHAENDELMIEKLGCCYTLYLGIENFVNTYPTPLNKNNDESQSILWDLLDLCENGKYFSTSMFAKIDCMIEKC